MKNDFGLAGVTDKLKRVPSKSDTVIKVKGESGAVSTNNDKLDKGKSITVEPITVLPDFRQRPSAEVLQQAIETGKRKPRIGVYSPIVSAAAEYLRETIPKYSASDEARKILEDEFEKRYPELVKQIKSGME